MAVGGDKKEIHCPDGQCPAKGRAIKDSSTNGWPAAIYEIDAVLRPPFAGPFNASGARGQYPAVFPRHASARMTYLQRRRLLVRNGAPPTHSGNSAAGAAGRPGEPGASSGVGLDRRENGFFRDRLSVPQAEPELAMKSVRRNLDGAVPGGPARQASRLSGGSKCVPSS